MRKLTFLRHFVIGGLFAITPLQVSGVDPSTVPPKQQTIEILQISSIVLNPSSVTGGAQVPGTVTLNRAAPSAGVSVTLRSSNTKVADVPQGVVVQAGATSATFIAQSYPIVMNPTVVAPPPSVQISAQIGNSAPKVVTLTVLPSTLSALTLNPASVAGGNSATGTVTISGPAPPGGLVIMLSSKPTTSSPPSKPILIPTERLQSGVSMPSQVAVAAGATSVSFAITTRPVSASTTFQVNASWGVFVTKTATLTVAPPDLASLSLTPSELFGGNQSDGTVTLTAPAPAEGMIINLKTSRASGGTTGTFAQCGQFPSVPATVTVASGAASANFKVTSYPGYGLYWVEASSTTNSSSKNLWVDSPVFKPVLPSSVKGGTPVQGTVQLTGPGVPANCGNRYFIISGNTNFAQVPAYVDVTPGATQATFPITTSALPSTSAPVTVTISVKGTLGPTPQTYSANLTITP